MTVSATHAPQNDRARQRARDDQHAKQEHDAEGLEHDPNAGSRSKALIGQEAARGRTAAFTKAQAPATGTMLASAKVPAASLSAEQRALLGELTTAGVTLLLAGDRLVVDLEVGPDHWIGSLAADQLLETLVGAEAAKELGSAAQFVRELPQRLHALGTRVRLDLGGDAPNDSFVVLDLARIAQGIDKGGLAGFRPVEAQLLFGKTGGVRVFADQQVKAGSAIPGEPIGGWFEIPDDGTLRAALASGDTLPAGGSVFGGAFYDGGLLRVAIKPTADATTGIVAHVDVLHVLARLQHLGEKAGAWFAKIASRIKDGAINLFQVIAGKLHFELPDMPGTWFDFDLRLQLPRLFSGGGGGFRFDLAGLLPTGFHLDFGGFSLGAMPSLKFPWLRAPKLGGFGVSWDQISHLLGGLSLELPRLPRLDFGLHVSGELSLGIGLDLRKLWPDVGDLALGFELDLTKLLGKLQRAGQWLLRKLRAAGDWAQRYIHLGSDGVLRIYDRQDPRGPMLGFHLLRLLDGADASDLVPTEMRYDDPDATATIEMGEVGAPDAQPGKEAVAGKASPKRPSGTLVMQRTGLAAPPSLTSTMALAASSTVDVELIQHGDHLTVWSKAASAIYEHEQAVRTTVNMRAVAAAIARHPRLAGIVEGRLPVKLDLEGSQLGPRFSFGQLALPGGVAVAGKAGKLSGHAGWKIEDLLGATDWTALVPTDLRIDHNSIGGLQLGQLSPPGQLVGGQRFPFEAPALRQSLLRADDTQSSVWAGVYHAPDLIAIALTKEADGKEGALAQVRLSFLLEQLRRLGDLGRGLLERIADLALPGWSARGKSDVWARLAEIAAAIGNKLLDLASGILKLKLGDGFLQWNLAAQLPHLGLDLDLTKLVPEFDFRLPKLPSLSLSFLRGVGFPGTIGSFSIPDLSKLLPGLPDLNLSGGFHVNVGWIDDLLGISLDLGDLFGDGSRSLQFKLPLDLLLRKAGQVASWLGKKGRDLASLRQYLHLGADGVLRIFDPGQPQGARVGFDLKRLFDGVSPGDLVPVEMHAEMAAQGRVLGEVSFGDAQISAEDKASAVAGGKNEGKVLVAPPTMKAGEAVSVPAPAWLREHLGVRDAARVQARLYLDPKTNDATVFVSMAGSDRGVEIRIYHQTLAELVSRIAPIKPAPGGIAIDHKAFARGKLKLTFGKQDGDELHGHLAWNVQSLLETSALESLTPDELVVERKEGSLTLSNDLDVSGLKRRATFDLAGWSWAQAALGGVASAEVYSNDLHPDARIALVTPGKGKRSGVELDLRKEFVGRLEHKMHVLAEKATTAIRKAMPQKRERPNPLGFQLRASSGGIMVERGKPGQPDHLYATFGWHQLAALAGGGDLELLVPDQFRIAAGSTSLEMTELTAEGKLAAGVPLIATLHPLLQEPLLAAGLSATQAIEFDVERSRATEATEASAQRLDAVAKVYDLDPDRNILHAKQLALGLSLEALLSQLLPHRRAWSKKAEPKQGRGTTIGASIGITDNVMHAEPGENQERGIEMSAELHHTSKAGKHKEVTIEAGWTLAQILDLLLHLQQDKDGGLVAAAGYLAPARLHGSFGTDRFRIEFGNDGRRTQYSCPVTDLPGLPMLLGTVLDAPTVNASTLHLALPSADQVKKTVEDAINLRLPFVPVAGCTLEVPSKDPQQPHLYEVKLSITPAAFKKLLFLIPGAGQILKVVDTLLEIATDPVGTIEALRYAPEALLDVFENAPEVFGKLKEKGFKGVAMMLVMGDHPTTKQAVFAGRVRKKMEAAGWKKGDKDKPPQFSEIPDDYWNWLGAQDDQALVDMYELGKLMEKSGIHIESSYTIPPGGLISADLRSKMDQIEHGFVEFAEVEHAAKANKDDPKLQAAAADKANELREHVRQVLSSGVKADKATAPEREGPGTDKPATFEPGAVESIADLQAPTPGQLDEARALFKSDGSDGTVVTVVDSEYLVQKYAGLSLAQLGDLLALDHTVIETASGKRRLELTKAGERDFVRALFMKRMAASGQSVPGQAGQPAPDAELVAAHRSAEQAAEIAASARGGGKPGKSGDGGEGGAHDGGLGSFDDDLDGDGGAGAGDLEAGHGELDGTADEGKAGATAESAGTGKATGQAGAGKTTSGSQREAPGTKGQQEAPKEAPKESLRDRVHMWPKDAAALVDFTTGTLKRDVVARKDIIGFDAGDGATIVGVELETFKPSPDHRVFEYILRVDVSVSGVVSPTYHAYTHVPSLGSNSAGEMRMEDSAGFLKKMRTAVTLDGATGEPAMASTITHGPFTIRVERVSSVKDYNVGERAPRSSKQSHMADVVLVVTWVNIANAEGAVVVRDADGNLRLVHAGGEVPIRLLLPRDQ